VIWALASPISAKILLVGGHLKFDPWHEEWSFQDTFRGRNEIIWINLKSYLFLKYNEMHRLHSSHASCKISNCFCFCVHMWKSCYSAS
jgi:hypothetical protein